GIRLSKVTGVQTCALPICHRSIVAGPFGIAANPVFSIVTTPSNHFPVGSLDCNGSGCHTTGNVNTGGFKLGAASLTAPTLSVARSEERRVGKGSGTRRTVA